MAQQVQDQGGHRQGRGQGIDPIENTTMAGQQLAAVLDACLALEQRLKKIAHHADRCQHQKQSGQHGPGQ
jgi:hypothetical protein